MAEPQEEDGGLEWEDIPSSLEGIQDKLPLICQYEGQLPQGLKLFSKQPVLLYKSYHKKKGYARTIFRDPSGPYYEVGQTLHIPDDFEGWFELVPPDFSRAGYYGNIEEIAKVMPHKLFTRTKISGIKVVVDENKEENYFQRSISAGTVLKVCSTFKAKWRTCAETGLRKKKKKEWITKEVKYLKCEEPDKTEILVPFTSRGKFHPVYQTGSSDSKCVFRMKDLLKEFTLPIKVRLIYGKPPVVPCIFTGFLVLKNCKTEDVIVGSTISYKRHALFELPVSNYVKVYGSKNVEDFKQLKSYKEAEHVCHRYSDCYTSLIKLSPEIDTEQGMIQHIPTETSNEQNNSLKTLDLITNISLTDDDPRAQFMQESSSETDSGSEQSLTMGTLIELKELSQRSSLQC